MDDGTLRAVGRSHVGKVRDHNEDTAAIAEIIHDGSTYFLWLVADGMGGGVKGDLASSTARDEMVTALQEAEDWSDPAKNLDVAARRANAAVYKEGTANGELSRSAMGTTVVGALMEANSGRYWLVNIGDSRAYLADGAKLRQLTRDHSLIAEQVAAGQLTAEEARTAGHRNVITRAVGADAVVEPEITGPWKLQPGERILLCSDGLHGMIEDDQIEEIISHNGLEAAADALIKAANAAGGRDNVTAVLGGWTADSGALEAPPTPVVAKKSRMMPLLAGSLAGILVIGAVTWMLWPKSSSTTLYTVPAGMGCEAVALRYSVPIEELLKMNPLIIDGQCAGKTLSVPKLAAAIATAPAKPTTVPPSATQPPPTIAPPSDTAIPSEPTQPAPGSAGSGGQRRGQR